MGARDLGLVGKFLRSFRRGETIFEAGGGGQQPGEGGNSPGIGREGTIAVRGGVYQLDGPQGGGCTTRLVRGTRRNLLIDTGPPSDAGLIARQLGMQGLSREDVHLFVLTHEHVDHVGGVPHFPARRVVAAHNRGANAIAFRDQSVLMSQASGRRVEDFHVDVHRHHGRRPGTAASPDGGAAPATPSPRRRLSATRGVA